MAKINIPLDTTTAGKLGKLRADKTWTQTVEDLLSGKPLPDWTFTNQDVAVAVGKPNPPIKLNFNEDTAINPGDQSSWRAVGVPDAVVPPPPPPPPPPSNTADLYLNGVRFTGSVSATAPYSLEARTNVAGDIKVQFVIDGRPFHPFNVPPFENDPPYAMDSLSFGAGSHTIVANVYAQNGTAILASVTGSIVEGGVVTPPPPPPPPPPPGGRDVRKQPFASSSFWNTAIGSGAIYRKVTLHQDGFGWTDEEPIVMGKATDALKDVWVNGDWPISGRLSGTKLGYKLPVPSGLTTHSATDIGNQANFSGGALMIDGDTIMEAQGLVVRSGGVAMMIERSKHSIRGDGRPQIGGHGGSSLSGVGGSLRVWEAQSDGPIQHALKCIVSDLDLSPALGGYRWPARNADSGYAGRYVGGDPELRMGALLALRPEFDMGQLATAFGKRFAAAVRDYGMYCVDEGYGTSWKPLMTVAEIGVNEALDARYGSTLEGGAIFADLARVWAGLHVITNNGPSSIGGGGTPRVPPLPEV